MKVLVGVFNQEEKAFFVIVKSLRTFVEPSFEALLVMTTAAASPGLGTETRTGTRGLQVVYSNHDRSSEIIVRVTT